MKAHLINLIKPIAKRIIPIAIWPLVMLRMLKGLGRRNAPAVIVLSLGNLGNASSVAKAAHEKGFRVILFCQEVPFRELKFLDVWHRLDSRTDFDCALKIAKSYDPTAVLLSEKNLLLPMQLHLSKALGLRGVTETSVATSNSKVQLRRALDQAEVPSLPWALLDEYKPGQPPLPGVIKPEMGTASKGVHFVADDAALNLDDSYFDTIKGDASVGGALMVESYVAGRQFDVEGLAMDGDYKVLVVVEEKYSEIPPDFPPDWFLFNPPIPAELSDKLIGRVFDGLRAFGVENGAWHCELRVDAQGEARILDYANRMGYNRQVTWAAGTSFAGGYVDVMTGRAGLPTDVNPQILMRFLSRDEGQTSALKRLVADHPDKIKLSSFLPFKFSYKQYYSHVVIAGESYDDMHALLSRYDLVPSEWDTFYPKEAPRAAS